jgi:hypothetical protein
METSSSSGTAGDFVGVYPTPRKSGEIESLQNVLRNALTFPEVQFQAKYGAQPWRYCKIVSRIKGEAGVYLIAREFHAGFEKSIFLYGRHLPRPLNAKSYFFRKGRSISLFDLASLSSRELQVTMFRSAAAFCYHLASPIPDKT